ncbi:PQQ-binding-like beta-propeller repeat protein [Amycolatopsis suaedae]|uniref:Pyrrolo-quinoline quinone repeat domain-containing protein n=1 Tax=Amycolatopsis suaedae TaxID=2510978 RepID=A0A4Q7J4Z1_9PSEU|nr:PQQ-binding-like beta-propeller repeat protein [Amycolatopsis suaedae]RZQ62641.1 hypothetical protein EWH70_16900 [Amycolatopsis suaedae]
MNDEPTEPEQDAGGRHRRPHPAAAPNQSAVLAEDVLRTPVVPTFGEGRHAAPETVRRSPWNRGRDRAVAVAIVVVVAVAGTVLWLNSDIRHTTSETADAGPALPDPPTSVPASLTQVWQAPSPATPVPVAEDTSVVTGAGNEVLGRDPVTGQVRWRYARDIPLCTVGGAWSKALAVYRKETQCSEVTMLDPSTGKRTAQRNGDAELGTRLVGDDSHVTATGTKLLNTWRDDLVKSVEYGEVPAIVNPNRQPRTGCVFGSVGTASGRVGVIERCPGDPADRLSVFKATPKEADTPEEIFTTVLAGRRAQLVAMTGKTTAVALPEQKVLVLFDAEGNQRTAYPLDLPPGDLAQDPPHGAPVVDEGMENLYWFTGSKTMALSKADLTPKWTLNGTLGPGRAFASQLVVPIPGGLAVVDEASGRTLRTIGVDRHGYPGPVRLEPLGPVLLEQRGDTLAALR